MSRVDPNPLLTDSTTLIELSDTGDLMIDCHAHFEPRMLDAARMLQKLDEIGVDKVALIPRMNGLLPHTPEALLTAMRFCMRRSWLRPIAEQIHRFTLTGEGDIRLKGETIPIYKQPDNREVLELASHFPDRFYAWLFLNPAGPDRPQDVLERYGDHPAIIGIKLHPHWHDYRTETLDPIFKAASSRRWPVLIHLGFGERGDFRALAESYPDVTIIAAHAGFPFFDDLWAIAGGYPNLYVDLSSPYITESLARDTVKAMGPSRCLYGTDAPYGFEAEDDSYDYGAIKGWVDRMDLTGREKDRVFGETFAELIQR